MALGTSIALIAIGAILKFAVSFSITGIDINIVGLILMIVGVLGLAISLVMMIASPGGARDPRDAPTRRF